MQGLSAQSLLRSVALPAIAGVLLLGVGTAATYRASPGAALTLLGSGGAVIVASVLVAAGRRRRAGSESTLAEQLLEVLPSALFVVDEWRPGRANLYVNPAYVALTGYGADEAVARHFDAFTIFADPLAVAELGQEPAPRSVTLRRRDGGLVAATLELRLLRGGAAGRRILGVLEREAAAPARDRHVDDRKSAQPAEPATRGDAFLSWLSHELRSPLNACVMWLDVLALAPQPDKVAKAADAIKRNLARQTKLVNDLNDAAKIRTGLEMQARPLDLAALLRQNVDAWQLLALAKQLTFEHRLELEAAPMEGDPDRLLQALSHLIDGSIASTPASGRLELRLRADGGTYVVELEDTGAPLSAEDMAHGFDPLWRSTASAKSRSGLGLGLAIAHHVAVRHGGYLEASSVGSGARFVFTLPRRPGDAGG